MTETEPWRITELPTPVLYAAAALAFTLWTLAVYRVGRWIEGRRGQRELTRAARSQLAGRAAELFAPFDGEFPGRPDDAWFLGAPIDYVVFDGLSDGDLDEVVFVEVKTGKGKLTVRERQIRDAIREGRVSWCEVRRVPER